MATSDAAASPTARPRRPSRGTPWHAFVLHRYDWSESSLILDLFTREGGRVVAAAKGAKRPSSNLRAVLLPFQPLHVLLGARHADDGDEVLTLRSAEWGGSDDDEGVAPDATRSATLLRGAALFRGFYLNELLLKLLPRSDPHPALFDAYAHTLAALAAARDCDDESPRAQAALRAFELTLLREMGWLADLGVVTVTQTPLDPATGYALRADGGLAIADRGTDAISGAHWLRLHAALVERAPDELRRACEPSEVAAALRAMLRHALAPHVGPAGLRTRDVAVGLSRLAQRATRARIGA